MAEEIGGTVGPLTFLASFPNCYPFAGIRYHTCDLYFRAALTCSPETLRADPDEVAALRWLEPARVSRELLAFDYLRALWNSLLAAGIFH